MKYILEIILLVLPPLVFKLWRGRNGTSHPSYFNAMWTVILMMGASIAVSTYELSFELLERLRSLKWIHLQCLAVALTGHGLFFPPLMNAVLLKRSHNKFNTTHNSKWSWGKADTIYCLDHLSPTAWPDKLFIKLGISWQVRLIGYATLFLASVLWFCWSSFRSLESYLH